MIKVVVCSGIDMRVFFILIVLICKFLIFVFIWYGLDLELIYVC